MLMGYLFVTASSGPKVGLVVITRARHLIPEDSSQLKLTNSSKSQVESWNMTWLAKPTRVG